MGKFHKNSGRILEFEVQIKQDKDGINRVHIYIATDIDINKYWVVNDERHPDLSIIETDILNGLNLAQNHEDKDFSINEYKERTYLYVTYPDGELEQYTGKKV